MRTTRILAILALAELAAAQQLVADLNPQVSPGSSNPLYPLVLGNEVFFSGFDEDLDPTSREWAETYGFGFTTFAYEEAGAIEEDQWVDPNQGYVEGLSDSARDAYYAAL